jgi:hypothetical protein
MGPTAAACVCLAFTHWAPAAVMVLKYFASIGVFRFNMLLCIIGVLVLNIWYNRATDSK